jgi:hypothetical protein
MPRTRGNVERRRNSLSEADLNNIELRMENASLKAFEKHRQEDHAPILNQISSMRGDLKGIKWIGGSIAVLFAGIEAIASVFGGKHP